MILEQYEFQGQPGSETSVAPSFFATGLVGASFGESRVTPTAGADSINASGFNQVGAMYTFGFGVRPGYIASISQLELSTRSSATGPGSINVLASIDGGALITVASIIQSATSFNNQILNFSPLTGITSSVAFELVAANQTSATGGTIGNTGTFRVGDDSSNGLQVPFTIGGDISQTQAAVAEPSTFAVVVAGLIGLFLLRPRLKHGG